MIDYDKWQEMYHYLRSNKTRTFLTAFGVFWGIFMLVVMMGAGNGLRNSVYEGFEGFATNSAFVWAQRTSEPYKGFKPGRNWNFTNDDMVAIKERIKEVDILAPRINGFGANGNNVVRGDKTGAFTINGDYPEIIKIDPMSIPKGRFINQSDIDEKRKVAVIGKRVEEMLFDKGEDPIGKYIKIKGIYFMVVGTSKPINKMGGEGEKDAIIFIPFTTLQQTYNFGDIVHYFAVTAKKNIPVSIIEEKVIDLIKIRHDIAPIDKRAVGHFNLEAEFKKFSGLFAGIAGLVWIVGIGTLLAGVIGVSNIMLIIVKERTQEIGVKRALGATPRNIINQIITESIFLTTAAGYFGLALGVILLELINSAMENSGGDDSFIKNPTIDFKVGMTALAILVVSGAFAGLIPARKAVSIKTIDALRAEI